MVNFDAFGSQRIIQRIAYNQIIYQNLIFSVPTLKKFDEIPARADCINIPYPVQAILSIIFHPQTATLPGYSPFFPPPRFSYVNASGLPICSINYTINLELSFEVHTLWKRKLKEQFDLKFIKIYILKCF